MVGPWSDLERQRLTSHRARLFAEKSLRGGHFAKSVGDVTGGTEVTKVGQMQTPLGHFVRRQRAPSRRQLPITVARAPQGTGEAYQVWFHRCSCAARRGCSASDEVLSKLPNMAARGE